MSKILTESYGCGYARECRNNACVLKRVRCFGYQVELTKANQAKNLEIEKQLGGKGFVPQFVTRVKGDLIQLHCHDYQGF